MSGSSKILMGSGGEVLPSDDEFDNVSFLSHFDGANNGVNNAFDDSSDSNHTVSITGNPSQGTFGPFARPEGEWSNYFNGSSDYLTLASSADFGMGTGNFTWEAWINQTYRDGSTWSQLFSTDNYSTGNNISIWLTSSGNVAIYYVSSSSSFTTTSTFPVNTWTHIAVVRKGTGTDEFSIYINGVAGITGTMTTDFPDDGITIARHGSATSHYYTGYISNFRIVKGTAVYTGNFTPSTSALTAISGTSLLTCQSNRFKDNSSSAHAITVAGGPKVSAFTPILTSEVYDPAVNGASAFFLGAGNYLSAADSADWTLGDTFTIEAWIYPTVLNSYNTIIEQNESSGFYYSALASGAMQFYKTPGGAVQVDSAAVLVTNQWNHVAFVVSSGTGYHYINGSRSGSSGSIDITDIAGGIQIGQQGSSHPYTGYISNLRIVKGTAVYSGTTYTVPTTPLTAITNTKLLLNMADGQVLDSAAQHNMSLVGNADSSTSDKKFGTASLALDGTGDGALVRGVQDFTGSFTIECWAKTPNTSAKFMWNVGQYKMECGITGNILRLWTGSAYTSFFTGGEFTVDTWHHVAVVRNGDGTGNIKVYLDGTASSTTISDNQTFVATSNIFVIGGEWGSTSAIHTAGAWEGYMDELRISRYARYTSNFTPATEAFPDKGQ